jgi:hypothetical protein
LGKVKFKKKFANLVFDIIGGMQINIKDVSVDSGGDDISSIKEETEEVF